jgi:hypothetical protein
MLLGISIIALFCQDIREEKSGTDIIIGVMPDNISVPSVPFILPKLSVYARVNIALSREPPRIIQLKLTQQSAPEVSISAIDAPLIEKTIRESREKGSANAGLISKAILVNFKIEKQGRLDVKAIVDEQEFVCGTLNVEVTPV